MKALIAVVVTMILAGCSGMGSLDRSAPASGMQGDAMYRGGGSGSSGK